MSVLARNRVCLVEDDEIMGESLVDRFALEKLPCDWFRDADSALAALEGEVYAALITDIRLPGRGGEELFGVLLERPRPPPPTLFITGFGATDQAVRLLKLGARDYITKPFDLEELLEKLRAMCPGLFLEPAPAASESHLGIAPAIRRLQGTLARVAGYDSGVLITGESGVGKEYAARYVHQCADPEGRTPFLAVNCAALPEHLLEAELFGHEKGAFTGAVRAHRGVFERAHGGTLFLDEVGDMPPAMQAKLLRVLQDGSFHRLGGERPVHAQVRLICATNRDLRSLSEAGQFREDLYYRINLVHVHIPPLRERPEDILWFADLFLADNVQASGVQHHFAPDSRRHLAAQAWAGNLRELRHAVDRACMLADGPTLVPEHFNPDLMAAAPPAQAAAPIDDDLRIYLERCEADYIREALAAHQGRVTETAVALGISRKNLWEKMRKHGLRS